MAGERNGEEFIPILRIEAWDPDTQSRIGDASSARSYVLAGVPETSGPIGVRATARDFGFTTELDDNIPEAESFIVC